ncbi:MAG: exodeoxyribonuclease V subunit gamma [Desulfobulbaceae bacterium]|uniref:Exodeoxyribonuclease V subunit gamma n=1 Tax=Candidatus Desulfobia pelagia TaxID=2841692 RepID=A0A8J6N8K6_9BACT|nr:exodeoxyribonuclease V subunit gamma [Candidatus Desulfobia pelagia]
MENLVGQLADIVQQEPLHPLQAETIVVQSQGMARWLSMALASRLSVWANGSFPFPNKILEDITRLILPESSGLHFYNREEAVWQIMNLFQDLPDSPVFFSVRNYTDAPLKKYQLARTLAGLFDQYAVYRPDVVSSWERGEDTDWQAVLWRMLVNRYNLTSRASILQMLAERLECGHDLPLPGRISVFGISLLPPLFLKVFNALARQCDVCFFHLNPCCQWWADIQSEREKFYFARKHGAGGEDLYLETGNSLLASMGGLGRDFLAMLQEYDFQERDCYAAPDGDTVLQSIQRDILDLSEGDCGRRYDGSIVVNSCHSPMREVEVLQNHLLSLFEEDESLRPRDIIVMAPDIEVYSPFVQAVFELGTDDHRYMPFMIADSSMGRQNQLADSFLALLELAGSRFENSRIQEVLHYQPVQARFGLTNDLEKIAEWLEGTAIRWGRDQGHRQALGLPGFSENTWRAGFDRLLLGYVMSGGVLFKGVLPYDGIDEGDGDVLGRLMAAFSCIARHIELLEKSWDLSTWSRLLLDLLDECLAVGQEQEQDALFLRSLISSLGSYQDRAAYADSIPLEVVKAYIRQMLEQEKSPYGYLTGGITFCSMLPMRAVPFKVICLLGMEDGSFPRPQPVMSFDRMAQKPRPGDRSRRNDDRYLFLEALLSARKQFYVSFVGQSVRDDSVLPPSVLVSELLEYVSRTCRLEEGEKEEPELITRQRLQAFSPDYFRSGKLFSYDEIYCRAAEKLLAGADADVGFWQDLPLDPPDSEFRQVAMQDLIAFILHPVRFFCNRRLDIVLRRPMESAEDDEPVRIDGLSRYQLSDDAVSLMFAEKEKGEIVPLLKAKGMLPHGTPGDIFGAEIVDDVLLFTERLRQYCLTEGLPLDVDVQCGDFYVQGRLPDLRDNGLLLARCASLKGKDLLRAWVMHLLLNCQAEENTSLPRTTTILTRDETLQLRPVANPSAALNVLLDIYWQGLSEPIPFFTETSYVFARWAAEGKEAKARTDAREKWAGEYNPARECDDIYFSFRYHDTHPLGDRFEDLARKMYMPLLSHLDEIGGDMP